MPRQFSPKVITTNHLLEGNAVYFTMEGSWSAEFADAEVFSNQNSAELALAQANKQTLVHVGAYLADAEIGASGLPRPVHYRERLRAKGPTNYFHGKQAGEVNV